MDKVIEYFLEEVVKDKKYYKIIEIGLTLLALLVPSFSYLFFYNRDLFLNLDFFKLICLSTSLNGTFFIAIYIYNLNYYKILIVKKSVIRSIIDIEQIEFTIRLKSIEVEISEKLNDVVSEKLFFKTITSLLIFIFLIHLVYLITIIFNININDSKNYIYVISIFLILVDSVKQYYLYKNEYTKGIKINHKNLKNQGNVYIFIFIFSIFLLSKLLFF